MPVEPKKPISKQQYGAGVRQIPTKAGPAIGTGYESRFGDRFRKPDERIAIDNIAQRERQTQELSVRRGQISKNIDLLMSFDTLDYRIKNEVKFTKNFMNVVFAD